MTSSLPEWIANVPMKTVGVLCATHIFGKNIESRQILLAGKRYFHNAVENVVNYVLNPILPPLHSGMNAKTGNSEAAMALRNIRDCFNYIFHIQVEYFRLLNRLRPDRFKSKRTGVDFNLNQFMAKGPTLLNSEKRYLILSKIDGAQPYDLRLDWNAEFDWVEDFICDEFGDRLRWAQEAYTKTLLLGEWYSGREKNLIIPLKVIMDDLSEYFEHIGLAAYYMAKNGKRRSDENIALIRENLLATCRHLERFTIDMLRVNMFTIVKHDLDKLSDAELDAVVLIRAEDDSYIGQSRFLNRFERYSDILQHLYDTVDFVLTP